MIKQKPPRLSPPTAGCARAIWAARSRRVVFHHGRLKELITKAAENIAPGEIDEALLRHPAVLEAAAYGVAHALYGQDVEAAVVLKSDAWVSEDELRGWCWDLVGDFKSPRLIRFLPELPKGPSGKVQRLRLLSI